MRTLWMHVGTGKAGSSALQYAFTTHADRLATAGIVYKDNPVRQAIVERGIATGGNGADIRSALRSKNVPEAIRIALDLMNEPGSTLLSNENIFSTKLYVLEAFRDALLRHVSVIKAFVVFRPQVDALPSEFLQTVKDNTRTTRQITPDEFSLDFIRRPRFNLFFCAKKLIRVFGANNVTMCWYPEAIRTGGIVAPAFEWMGVPPPVRDHRVINPSPSHESMLVLQRANAAGIGSRRFSDKFLMAAHDRGLTGTKVTLSESVTRYIERETFATNSALLKAYFPHLSIERELAPVDIAPQTIDREMMAKLTDLAARVARDMNLNAQQIQETFGSEAILYA